MDADKDDLKDDADNPEEETSSSESDIDQPESATKKPENDPLTSSALVQSTVDKPPILRSDKNYIESIANKDYRLNFDKAIKELSAWDFKTIQIDPQKLAQSLSRFVTVGSIIHKLTPDELTVIGNHDGDYANKETVDVHTNAGVIVPNTIEGLMANGTRFFDALVYIGLEEKQRPACSPIELTADKSGKQAPPVYDDVNTLTTFIFVIFFYILIRAHPPSDDEAYRNQPVPKFITNIMGVKESMTEIVDYVSTFDLVKLDPTWVRFIPMNHLSQEAVNRFGLGVAGYRIVSIFNILKPDLYTDGTVTGDKKKMSEKPDYLDTAILVMKSFVQAGHCWDFHPATRNPDIITKYGNINKNANNLIIECFTTKTIENLKKLNKLSVTPKFDPSHTNYRSWDKATVYRATKPIFGKKSGVSTR